ncbi:MAG: 50S ribosomal protein L22 [Candidatus Nomurabacteria bacterium GW2011_GWE1_32_28]|uniref:Large ribosomal subunit protein uL22 n=1 Tax=Candidatus Nomurabacteria bacterium GW2011_GWF1_31_48 TaxID=1618767 RepID=A0A0F9YFX3_9BACT|nr:MAG: 50S ribosomal protein L22 [Candidatus Nomurabacteria bacterium GW2011_GWF2_30_133]KKP28716.1 MAG: 50S ribosomal protein L22 [Candidatus Nomurabacteria bacterium GW2011_GWE2_31_40]KKP30293.1 MAG: 50S ribosomal protein L22 [Candidatus Nomurabacteria bacterium GW2011_GWF1_31_48]KKP34820.1 MAG: 50S ribosomal protein L22 [Candidatus Nomurabacteria bacterium GW2011_GWE1_32_28]HAS80722.1 50S ribosomal protein L22 [Candidatus Nomurabacteria bacterium]
MKAFLKNYRQAPRKVRLVAGLIKGKKVDEAIPMLDFLVKRAGFPIKKLLLSAVSNAFQLGVKKENLYIKELRVDKGIIMKRMMPAAMGTGHRINKRTSHVTLVLAEKTEKVKKGKLVNKVVSTVVKETKSKKVSTKKVENKK